MFQTQHDALPIASHDEAARQAFTAALRRNFTTKLWPGNRDLYQIAVRPEFEEKEQREPKNAQEIRAAMQRTFYHRGVNLVGRTAQEMLWDNVGESVERQVDTLRAVASRPAVLGTLKTNPDLAMPRYVEAVDIHAMPGNFHTELADDDVFAGALYDRGVYVFAFGGLGPLNDALGRCTAAFLREKFPDLNPKRILDVGCGPGFSTLPWKEAFPDAEIYGIDIAAPTVRYAHARAESLGVPVHFSQQNAAETSFPDGHFDIVCSLLLLHECPIDVNKAVFREAYRLLAPGGVMLHDGYTASNDPLTTFMSSWFSHNANEPFSAGLYKLDYERDFIEAGFKPGSFFNGIRESVYLKGQLPPLKFAGAVKT